MMTTPIDWTNPLKGLEEACKQNWQNEKRKAFWRSYTEVFSYWERLCYICKRIEDDEKAVRETSLFARMQRKEELTTEGKTKFTESCIYLRIDIDDFFIYSRILMDKIAWLTRLFFKKDNISYHSFADHRDFFLNRNNQPFLEDEKYAECIRTQTFWFNGILKRIRDQMIVHGGEYMTGTFHSSYGKIGTLRFNQDRGKYTPQLLQLKEKYAEKYPVLKGVENNVYEIMDCFNRYDIKVDETDEKILDETTKALGGKTPDLEEVLKQISKFLEFYNNHFAERVRQMSNIVSQTPSL